MSDKKHQPSHKKIKRSLEKGEAPYHLALVQWVPVVVVASLLPTIAAAVARSFSLSSFLLLDSRDRKLSLLVASSLQEQIVGVGMGICSLILVAGCAGLLGVVCLRVGRQPAMGLRCKVQLINPLAYPNRMRSGLQLQVKHAVAVVVMVILSIFLTCKNWESVVSCLSGVVSYSCFLERMVISFILPLSLFGGGIALLLAFSEKRQNYRQLMMTDEEARKEAEDDQSDPHVKSEQRKLFEALMNQELVERVKRAGVVVIE